jgi:protein-arginine kinase activator protein McsA|tara:strand:+ start:318 stop:563 length:246 start_codon:yes stop_codon:yes gene_type:complete
MNNDEIKKLALLVANEVVKKLTEYEFEVFDPPEEDEEEKLLAELARLMTLLSSYLESEQYEKCSVIKKKISKIENRLNNNE